MTKVTRHIGSCICFAGGSGWFLAWQSTKKVTFINNTPLIQLRVCATQLELNFKWMVDRATNRLANSNKCGEKCHLTP